MPKLQCGLRVERRLYKWGRARGSGCLPRDMACPADCEQNNRGRDGGYATQQTLPLQPVLQAARLCHEPGRRGIV
jgi:hypothetical protein